MAVTLLAACTGEPPTVPVVDTPSPTPTNALFAVPMPTATPTTVPIAHPSPEAGSPTPSPTSAPTPAPIRTPTPAPTVDLALDATAEVSGYWSDGSANIDLTATVRNRGGLRLDGPVQVAVTCTHDGATVEGCGETLNVTLPDGYGPASDTLILRVPAGENAIGIGYGGGQTQTLSVHVPERILGVDRGAWECFSDASNVGTAWEEDEGAGCGAWGEPTVTKWDQGSPVRISASGPESFVAEFKDVISLLSPVFNLRFEWVDAGASADVAAYVGLTIPEAESQGVFCERLEALGCASTARVSGEIIGAKILVFNRWLRPGAEFHDFDERNRRSLRFAMIHEAVHALTLMRHREELLSVMNRSVHQRAELSPMDEALLRLHGHELVEPGMHLTDIEQLIVFNDELLDPRQPDARLAAWTLVSDAYGGIRNATSASFRVRSSSPGCSTEFGWADYAVGNLTRAHSYFEWVRIDDGTGAVYALQPGSSSEHWRESRSGWSRANLGEHASGIPGWRGDLSDPHYLLELILYYADWSEADISTNADGQAVLRFRLELSDTVDQASARVDIVLLIDQDSGVLSGYTTNWELPGQACGTHQVEAVDGRYGTDFTFPDAVQRGSDLLQECDVPSLGVVSGYTRRSGEWLRECGLDAATEGYSRSFRFSLDDWSFLRFELASYDDVAGAYRHYYPQGRRRGYELGEGCRSRYVCASIASRSR